MKKENKTVGVKVGKIVGNGIQYIAFVLLIKSLLSIVYFFRFMRDFFEGVRQGAREEIGLK
jgi:NADH:ubiquinone oxidoreductase subunit 2 (subunit N)